MTKELKYLIIHCTATKEGQAITPETIKRWHLSPPPTGRGWRKVGYSDLILLNGSRHQFVKHNSDKWITEDEITNGVSGINSISRHVCYVGGLDNNGKGKNTLTAKQSLMLTSIIKEVLQYAPDVLIAGHNQFSNKNCPSFFVPTYLKQIGISEKNIYTQDPYGYGK